MFVNEAIAYVAIEYHEAANLLMDKTAKPRSGQEEEEASVPSNFLKPSINAEIIAIELFLKSLWISNELELPTGLAAEPDREVLEYESLPHPQVGRDGGHDLKKNFDKICDEVKDQLRGRRSTIEKDLEALEGVFKLSRYPFEPMEINGKLTGNLKKGAQIWQWKLAGFNVALIFEVGKCLDEFVRGN